MGDGNNTKVVDENMLMTETVEINLYPIIIKHLEGLGYVLEKIPDRNKILREDLQKISLDKTFPDWKKYYLK